MLNRAYYSQCVADFISQNVLSIIGELASNHPFDLDPLQRLSWIESIRILKMQLLSFDGAHILFEYSIPRVGRRIDNVLICSGIVFLLEFKVGEKSYPHHAVDQVVDYALDLKNFHAQSHNKKIVPILVATDAPSVNNTLSIDSDGVFKPLYCNGRNIGITIESVILNFKEQEFEPQVWIDSEYRPTPTIIEAAQALYRDHRVTDISRNDADAINLAETTKAVSQIISKSKSNHRKSICFITGVPGAGKTLAGLNIANEHRSSSEGSHAVFLSGNQPLVDVLKEALASDKSAREKVQKNIALREVRSFIQIIHHFRDEAVVSSLPPVDHVAIFDEAQRAWDEPSLTKFMHQKKGIPEFHKSEPEFLIEYLDRHQDWAVIVCLIGGGQEINTGEAGLLEWFKSLENNFQHWDVYLSSNLIDSEYVAESSLDLLVKNLNYSYVNELHLSVSLRSFRSENVSAFIKSLLDAKIEESRSILSKVLPTFPIALTRDFDLAKQWVLSQARGTERYGIIASSGAKRLRKFGVWVQSKADAANWFLKNKDDVRSSYFLEETATEFDIQGLEVDWAIVCWDGDLRYQNNTFKHFKFNGSRWMNINKLDDQKYQKNAYRVLLTRARQGFIIFVPCGDDSDLTRPHEYYDGTYNYLKEIGIPEVK